MKSVINYHNMNVLNNTAKTEEGSNCRNGNNCTSFTNHRSCQTSPTISKKVYIGIAETDFKHRFNNHTKSFNLEHYENNTELSKEYCK